MSVQQIGLSLTIVGVVLLPILLFAFSLVSTAMWTIGEEKKHDIGTKHTLLQAV